MSSKVTTAAIVGCLFVGFLCLERVLPLRKRKTELLGRLLLNLAVSALAFLIAGLLVRPGALATLNWSSQQSFGLLHLLSLPPVASFVVAFLLMDLSFYWWHVANHRISFLWRFHNVHHFDPDLDVSTGFRFHFGEVFMSAAFRVIQVALIGVSMPAFAAYELVFQANTLFHHSNVRLPIRLERFLNKFLVTPRMHGIHHSQRRHETNSNYGVVFPWWDRLHRTLGLNVPHSEIVIGVPGYSRPEDNRMLNVLIAPFRPQRDYWPEQGTGGNVPSLKEPGSTTTATSVAPGKRTTLAE
jgi:sterol desaturase/sphingolipid hydroxylase (fatty acid hydroxylase superfamily)